MKDAKQNLIDNQRIDWIDMAKGYGILFVILAHLGVDGIIDSWIYTFHMPLFFFLSGSVFSTKYDFSTFLKRKIKSMIIPYFALGIPMIFFYSAINGESRFDVKSILTLLEKLFVQRRFWTLWFIACLFWLNIVFYIICKKCQSDRLLALIVSGMCLAGLLYYHWGGSALPWNIDGVFPASFFFFAGYLFKKNYMRIRSFFTIWKSIATFFILGTVNIVFGYLNIKISGTGLDMFLSTYGFPPLAFLSAFAGIICVVIFSHWFNVKCIKYIGKNSMLYYAWHQTIGIPVVWWLFELAGAEMIISGMPALLIDRLLKMVVIVLMLTFCNIILLNTRLKFALGK